LPLARDSRTGKAKTMIRVATLSVLYVAVMAVFVTAYSFL
jgi:hypothetical protein